MQAIKVGRYADPAAVELLGYVEPEDRSWAVLVGLDGRPRLARERPDAETGAAGGADGMEPIDVQEYGRGPAAGYVGYFEPRDRSWIVYVDVEGMPALFAEREQPSGAARGPLLTLDS